MAVLSGTYQHRIPKILVRRDDLRKTSVQFDIAVQKDLTPLALWHYTDNSSTGVAKEVICQIQMAVAVYAVLYSAVGLLWSERPMVIHDASFSFGNHETLWDTMRFVCHARINFFCRDSNLDSFGEIY